MEEPWRFDFNVKYINDTTPPQSFWPCYRSKFQLQTHKNYFYISLRSIHLDLFGTECNFCRKLDTLDLRVAKSSNFSHSYIDWYMWSATIWNIWIDKSTRIVIVIDQLENAYLRDEYHQQICTKFIDRNAVIAYVELIKKFQPRTPFALCSLHIVCTNRVHLISYAFAGQYQGYKELCMYIIHRATEPI